LNLFKVGRELIPKEVFVECEVYWRSQASRNLLQTAELLRVLRLLEMNRVLALPIKGPVLAASAYGDLSLRQFCDLDILVHREDINRVVTLLIGSGFKLVSAPTWLQRLPTPVSNKKDYGFISENGETRIELHWRLSGAHFDLTENPKFLWKRLDTVHLAGQAVRTLPLQDQLLYLTMHGSRHGWERLIWICDVAELVRARGSSIDWSRLLSRAGQLGSRRNILLGFFLAKDLLDAELPDEVLREIGSDQPVKQLAAQARGLVFRDDVTSKGLSYWRGYHLKARERFNERGRVRFHYLFRYLRLALTPNRRDYSSVPLPRYLAFAYYVIRPLRLVANYGLSLWKGSTNPLSKP
jgi:hypothetical protein